MLQKIKSRNWSILVFAVSVSTYIWLQFFSILYETHFWLVIILLGFQSVSGILWGVRTRYCNERNTKVLRVMIMTWAVAAFGIMTAKLLFFDQRLVRRADYITRMQTEVGIVNEEFALTTSDGVEIAGYRIPTGHSDVVILCHGGASSKNAYENVGFAQWLSYDFDIMAFDTRGHFESSGYWTGDGLTKLDLLAVLDYARSLGYERIGVLGTSLGGWTSILVGAEEGGIDSLVVLSAPLGNIRSTPEVAAIEFLKVLPGRLLVRALQGLRYHEYLDQDTKTPREVVTRLTTPTLLIYGNGDDVLGLTRDEIRQFYTQIPGVKKLCIFPEKVHLPQPWHFGSIYVIAREWFRETLHQQVESSYGSDEFDICTR